MSQICNENPCDGELGLSISGNLYFIEEEECTLTKPSMKHQLMKHKNVEEKNRIYIFGLTKFQFLCFVMPMLISIWYSAAMFFPAYFKRGKLSILFWTDGALVKDKDGYPSICPKTSICAEGVIQILLIALARLSAFASYVTLATSFSTKMHSTIHFLSSTYLSVHIPFEQFHKIHKYTGFTYFVLAMIHTFTHLIRWIFRNELQNQLFSQEGMTGLISMGLMLILVISMHPICKAIKWMIYEHRLNAHWLFLPYLLVLCFHSPRARIISTLFGVIWALDYSYGVIFRTHRLDVVEFTTLPDMAGTQMLWKNPQCFRCKSGEYVQIQIPWICKGGEQWHPFSLYLREATEEGVKGTRCHLPDKNKAERKCSLFEENPQRTIEKNGLANGTMCDNEDSQDKIQAYLETSLEKVYEDGFFISTEARQDPYRLYETSQVFIAPNGDWTKEVNKALRERIQQRTCWIRGPFISPYFVATKFRHLLFVASGIGITPALGVMGQYPGTGRTKVLIWMVRSKVMLKFFAPLLKDAHISLIFYTGKEKLTNEELTSIRNHGNSYVLQMRPSNLKGTIETIIVCFENVFEERNSTDLSKCQHMNLDTIESRHKESWCVMYCGGSITLNKMLKGFTKENRLGFESEFFNW